MEITHTVAVSTRAGWRAWLQRHHAKRREVWLIYHKKGSGKPRVEYNDAVEEALCFGWIDSTVKTIDELRYAQRFSPRKPGSNWSGPNLERIKRLVANGLMTPAGAAHLPGRQAAKQFQKAHEARTTAPTRAPKDLASALRTNARAAATWAALAPGYRRLNIRWLTEARRAPTRDARRKRIVANLARGIKHPMLSTGKSA